MLTSWPSVREPWRRGDCPGIYQVLSRLWRKLVCASRQDPIGQVNFNLQESSSSDSEQRKSGRKARQLCRQVAETLDLVLSGDSRDEILQSLRVVSVDPAPDATQLLVVVRSDLPGERFDPQLIATRLKEHSGRLRCEVAASITRKRAPAILFQIVR